MHSSERQATSASVRLLTLRSATAEGGTFGLHTLGYTRITNFPRSRVSRRRIIDPYTTKALYLSFPPPSLSLILTQTPPSCSLTHTPSPPLCSSSARVLFARTNTHTGTHTHTTLLFPLSYFLTVSLSLSLFLHLRFSSLSRNFCDPALL